MLKFDFNCQNYRLSTLSQNFPQQFCHQCYLNFLDELDPLILNQCYQYYQEAQSLFNFLEILPHYLVFFYSQYLRFIVILHLNRTGQSQFLIDQVLQTLSLLEESQKFHLLHPILLSNQAHSLQYL